MTARVFITRADLIDARIASLQRGGIFGGITRIFSGIHPEINGKLIRLRESPFFFIVIAGKIFPSLNHQKTHVIPAGTPPHHP